ncbi:MAG: fasciclin domain-containing protein [Rudanella sp.]|nr:fasciclin domain-containing protein [Rudanella sp.]
MTTQTVSKNLRLVFATLLVCSAPLFIGCNTEVTDPTPAPGTGTTTPGTGTATTPGTGTTTTPGTGTTTTPGTGTTTTPGTVTGGTGTVLATAAFVAAQDNLNFLEAAIARAGLTEDVNKGGLTLFAPTDDAFRAAGFASAAAVSAAPAADLQRILRYHLVGSVIDLSAFPTAVNTSYQTNLANGRLTVFKTSDANISVNTAKISKGNNPTTGSVVHIVNQVLTAPSVTANDQAKSNADLSFLLVAAERAGTTVQDLLTKSSTNGVTIFAPTNAAFKAAGYADEAAIRAADPKKLADILAYHVLPYQAFSQTFQNGSDIVTAQGNSVRFTVSGGKVTVTGKGNGSNAANITSADVVTSNGVIHVIDRVLLP